MGGVFLFTLKLLCSAFGCLLLLRVYMQFLRTPSNDAIYSFAHALTSWATKPASAFIPRSRHIDWPCVFVAYLVAVVYQFFHWFVGSGHFGIWPFFIGSGVLVVYWAVELAMWAALLFCILSWTNPTSSTYRTLSYLCYPYLAPFKKILPVWRNVDLSAVGFFILANIVLMILAPLT